MQTISAWQQLTFYLLMSRNNDSAKTIDYTLTNLSVCNVDNHIENVKFFFDSLCFDLSLFNMYILFYLAYHKKKPKKKARPYKI